MLKSLSFSSRGKNALLLAFSLLLVSSVIAQTTAFTYQGRLTDGGNPANDSYDLQFKLFDLLSGGTQQGSTQTLSNVTVTNGIFTVQLDFGTNVFTSNAGKFLEIGVRNAGGPTFTTLPQRQPVTSTPYAIQTLNASQLGGVAASQYVQTNDSRLTDARIPMGAAGGDLTGTYPNPTIVTGAVTDAKVANGISYSKLTGVPTSLPPSGTAGGDLTGSTYPNPAIASGAVTGTKIANATIPVGKLSATGSPSSTTFLRGDNTWSPLSSVGGTGASPTAIPLTLSGNTGAAAWNAPTSGSQAVTLSGNTTVEVPATCTPSMTITSYSGASTTWNLVMVTPSTSSTIWTQGATVMSCSTTAAMGSSCSVTAGSTVSAGTILTITSGAGVAPGGGGFLKAFSCF